jgi:hypothetical protein
MENIIRTKDGKVYRVDFKFNEDNVWARRLNKDFSLNQRLKDNNMIRTKDVEWLKGSLENTPNRPY